MTSDRQGQRRLLLVRHGETALNVAGRLRGRLDPSLTGQGLIEVRALARFVGLLRPARVVSGPLLRTMQTAALIAGETGLKPLIDDDLIDRDYGPWTGQVKTEVLQQWGSLNAAPGVEPTAAVHVRAMRALDSQVPFLGPQPVVLVSHDAVNSELLSCLDPSLGSADNIPQRTACYNVLEHDGRGWRVLLVDQIPPKGEASDEPRASQTS